MRSLLAAFTHKPLFLTAIFYGFVEVKFFPTPSAIFFLSGAMVLDLLSGIGKSWKQGKATSTEGFQKTVIKLTRYVCLILAVWILANVIGSQTGFKIDYSPFVNGVIGYLTFIEVYSVMENIEAADPNSKLTKLIKIFLKILRGRLNVDPSENLKNK